MGQDDDINASIAHIVLTCVSGINSRGLQYYRQSYTHPGMHINFLVHGVIGFLHYNSGTFNNDFTQAYFISHRASRYLALPCLMADLYRGDNSLSMLHLVSGLIPFTLTLVGKDNPELGNLVLACNIISLCHYSFKRDKEWGWFTAGAAVFAYFMTPKMGPKVLYPLGLALLDYCAYRINHARLERQN